MKPKFVTMSPYLPLPLSLLFLTLTAGLPHQPHFPPHFITNRNVHHAFRGTSIPEHLDIAACPKEFVTKPPLILISMDGFRSDFLDRGLTPTLSKLAKRGVYAPFIKPSYPTITFPNHYSIATGLIPPAHGIVANRFTDPVFNATFGPGKPTSFQKRFWGGEPIWKTVEKTGQLAATYFWPGSEVKGLNPTYWFSFNEMTPFTMRVNQILSWLDLPSHHRPRFLTLYFQEPDARGHDFGPDSPQINEALRDVDEAVRQLVEGLNQRSLLACVNILVVADHGMTLAGPEKVIQLRNIVPNFLNKVSSLWNGVFARFNARDGTDDSAVSLMRDLSCKRKEIHVYHKKHAPARWHIGAQRRIEDVVLDMEKGYQADGDGTYKPDLGDHGFDNYISDMNALFFAHGPSFKRGVEVEIFQNTELYNLMCLLTDSKPAPNNGTWGALHHLLLNPPALQNSQKGFATPPIAGLSSDREDFEERLEDSECSLEGEFEDSEPKFVRTLAHAQVVGVRSLGFWHAPWGLPLVSRKDIPGSLLLLHQTHITAYSRAIRSPLWTSFILDGTRHSSINSTVNWLPDVRIHPKDEVPVCSRKGRDALKGTDFTWQPIYKPEFANSPYNADMGRLSSNGILMSSLLRESWNILSDVLVGWVKTYGNLQVVAGPVFDGDYDTLKDDYKKWKVSGDAVAVPTHLFVVVTRCQLGFGGLHGCPSDRLDSLSFILPQYLPVSNCQSPLDYLREFSAKVKDVELITGLHFYPALQEKDRIRQLIRIHSNLWGRESYANRIRSDLFGLKRKR